MTDSDEAGENGCNPLRPVEGTETQAANGSTPQWDCCNPLRPVEGTET